MTDLSLLEALSEIAAQEREWMEQGYSVGTLVKDPAHWARYGVFTRPDLEAYFAREADKEARKDFWAEFDAEMQAEMDREFEERERIDALTAWERPSAADIVANHYQEGWA